MTREEKIESLRKKQVALVLKETKKKEELEVISAQYKKLNEQISALENAELSEALKEQKASPAEAIKLLKAIKKMKISPVEAVELLKNLNGETVQEEEQLEDGEENV